MFEFYWMWFILWCHVTCHDVRSRCLSVNLFYERPMSRRSPHASGFDRRRADARQGREDLDGRGYPHVTLFPAAAVAVRPRAPPGARPRP